MDAAGQGQQGAHDQLAAADPVPLGLQLGRAAFHEHLQRGWEAVHPGVQGRHRPAFGGALPRLRREVAGALGRRGLGERGGEYLLHDRDGAGELERLRAGVLADDDRFEVPVRPHELPGGVQVARHTGGFSVQVHAEQIEGRYPRSTL